MLDQERNEALMRVDADKPMGRLLRRYWHPIAAVSEFIDQHTKPVRLLGEDLVLYKDLSGTFGLLDRHCPHRRADLSYGFVETCGLRCNYHGWLFDKDGSCLAQPYEDVEDPSGRLRKTVISQSYLVQECAGLLWAYLGPTPAPLVPNWEPYHWKNGFVQIVFSEVPCNWFQCQENSIDPVHFEWMHSNWAIRLSGHTGPYSPIHLKLAFEEFEYGFTYKRIREDTDERHPLWTIGRVCLWPYALFTGGHFEWRVPIDDENTLSIGWFYSRVPKERGPYVQLSIPYWYAPIKDEKTGRWISSHVMNQDFTGWVGQGTMADRSREHLGRSDKGVAMIRHRFFEDMKKIERGQDPKSVIRDPKKNERIQLPIVDLDFFRDGYSNNEANAAGGENRRPAKRFLSLYGQPPEVRRAYEEAMGFKMEDSER